MHKLLLYHTSQCNPHFYWENNAVAKLLKANSIKTFSEYVKACDEAGCIHYNQSLFDDYISSL